MIKIYSKPNCNHCIQAENWLTRHQFSYHKVDITQDQIALSFLKQQGHKSVPQLYIGGKLLPGGNAGLQSLSPEKLQEIIHVSH